MKFFKRNKNEETNNVAQPTKEELKETVNNINTNEDYGLTPEIIQAIDNVIPVISNGDLNLIPSVYNSEVLTSSIASTSIEDLIILADYAHSFIMKDEKNKQGFVPTFLNAIASGIAGKIKTAEKLYTVYSSLLKKPFPQIASGFALIFFKEENTSEWVEDYTENHNAGVYVKALEGDEIKNYFEELAALGIANIGIESNISKITINHKPIFGIEFESISDPAVQFLSLRFIQLDKSKLYHDNAKHAHGALLSSIISSKFLCPGKTVNGKFIAASLKKGDSSFLSAFTDKRELQLSMDENPAAKEFLETAEIKELTFPEMEEFLMNPQISALVINIAGMGFTLRREVYKSLYEVIKANPGKKVAINIE